MACCAEQARYLLCDLVVDYTDPLDQLPRKTFFDQELRLLRFLHERIPEVVLRD